jgi:hypothetical protein
MVRSSPEEFDPWVFVIGRRRRAPHGKTDMLIGSIAGSASIMSWYSANDISSRAAVVHEILQ